MNATSIFVLRLVAMRRICASATTSASPWRSRSDAIRRDCARLADGPAKANATMPSTTTAPIITNSSGIYHGFSNSYYKWW